MKRKWVILATLLLIFSLQNVQSYSLLGYKWQTGTFNYYINPANADVGASATISALKAGENKWGNWCTGIYMGQVTTKTVSNNGQNTVFFRAKKNGTVIATTYIYYSGNSILDFDIVWWDRAWKFFGTAATCANGFYILDVAAHEFGHAIGIGHSTRAAATMYSTTVPCNTSLRTLATDDENAANAAY